MSFLRTTLFDTLAQLRPDMQPEWGAMSPQHIVEHFILALAISSGVLDVPVMESPERVARNYDYLFTQDQPLRRGVRMPMLPETPPPYEFASLEEAIERLRSSVEHFYHYFQQKPDARPAHPAFGQLSFADWERFHEKHFRHHLTQFGL